MGCGGNGDRGAKHNAIRDVIFAAAQSASLSPSREAAHLVADSAARPADVLLPNWSQGRSAALDVHVISPLQASLVAKAAYSAGQALRDGVDRKLRANLESCRSARMNCIPMVAESLGGLASDFIETIRNIGNSIMLRSGSADATKHLFGRISIALWRGNASAWLHRMPPLPPELDGVT